jgi:hypothetical protein
LPPLPPQILEEVVGKDEELYKLLREREKCKWAISQVSRLLNERRISPTTYREIT